MARTRAEQDLADYRGGVITLEQLAQRWTRKFKPVPQIEKTIEAIEFGGAEEKMLGGPGTWDEIVTFELTGLLSREDYLFIGDYVDQKVGR